MQGAGDESAQQSGGNMDTVTDMLKLILPEGTVVSTKINMGNEEKIPLWAGNINFPSHWPYCESV